jgi:hypothetical protein
LVRGHTTASAARCTFTVSVSPLLWLLLPICRRNLPSSVNFKSASSATGFKPAMPEVGQLVAADPGEALVVDVDAVLALGPLEAAARAAPGFERNCRRGRTP